MKIDRKLNFVSTITREDGSLVYLHVVPFPYEVVQENCVLLGNMFHNFFTSVGTTAAPRVAAMMLRNILKAQQDAGDLPAGTPTLVDDIQRLTTVIFNDNGVWRPVPLEVAFKRKSSIRMNTARLRVKWCFYGLLCYSESQPDRPDGGENARNVQWATRLIERYGVSRFFTDVEDGYRYPDPASPAGTVVHSLLTGPPVRVPGTLPGTGFWRLQKPAPFPAAVHSGRNKTEGLFQWQLNPLLKLMFRTRNFRRSGKIQ